MDGEPAGSPPRVRPASLPPTPPQTTNSRYDEVLDLAKDVAARSYSGWSHEAREDLVSEVMVKYWGRWGRGPGPDNARAWLHRVTRNTAINLNAARERRPELLVAGGAESGEMGPAGLLDGMFANVRRQRLPTPSTIVVDRKLLNMVLGLVGKRQRELIEMKYLDNLSAAEIATSFRTSLAGANQAVSRAKRALAKELSARPDLLRELRDLPTSGLR